MNVLGLFSGIGGFELGLQRAGFNISAMCEIEPFCQAVLRKHWPDVPIFDDVRNFPSGYGALPHGFKPDVICGGFPCQPTSVAGKRKGSTDSRWLWPEYFRIVQAYRPAWVVGENTVGLASMGLDQVLSDLESEGYEARTFNIPAWAVGADHERQRLWIIAHANRARLQERFMQPGVQGKARCNDDGKDSAVGAWWKTRPNLVRGINGIPGRVDRIRALGNSVYPAIPQIIGRAIMQAEGLA